MSSSAILSCLAAQFTEQHGLVHAKGLCHGGKYGQFQPFHIAFDESTRGNPRNRWVAGFVLHFLRFYIFKRGIGVHHAGIGKFFHAGRSWVYPPPQGRHRHSQLVEGGIADPSLPQELPQGLLNLLMGSMAITFPEAFTSLLSSSV